MSSDLIASAGSRILRSRWLVRAPIWIYKARAGVILGSRLLMLEHIGRRSGARRYVVLEVIGRPAANSYLVASGFGAKAQWFRNIAANPRVRVYVGSRPPAAGIARVLDQQEADSALANYIARHPWLWARFTAVLQETLGTEITETNTPLPLVELRLETATGRSAHLG